MKWIVEEETITDSHGRRVTKGILPGLCFSKDSYRKQVDARLIRAVIGGGRGK